MAYVGACFAAPGFAEKVTLAEKHLGLNPEQKWLLGQVVETILPKTNLPGAEELKLADFVVLMIQDCTKSEVQSAFVQGLNGVNLAAQAHHKKTFEALSVKQRVALLNDGLNGKGLPKDSGILASDWKTFVNETKRFTVMGFMQSQYVLTEVFPHVQIPGPFQADVAIENARF